MNFIDKILLEGMYAFGDSVYDIDYFKNIDPKNIKKKAYIIASKFGVDSVYQAKSGSCYFKIFNSEDHFIYEVRISDHTSTKKSSYYQIIELSYSQSISEMVNTINKRLYHQ